MSSDVAARPEILDHPLLVEARKNHYDCTLHVKFQVWNPSALTYQPLSGMRVDVVSKDGSIRLHGQTDALGMLLDDANPVPLTIIKADKIPLDQDLHFEILGPTGGSTLKTATWYGTKTFDIDKWSTRGWIEPDGKQLGHFRPDTTNFGQAGTPIVLSVGVAYRLDLFYRKEFKRDVAFPSGLTINVRLNDATHPYDSQDTVFQKPISGVIFDTKPRIDDTPGDNIAFELEFDIAADTAISQQKVDGSIVTYTGEIPLADFDSILSSKIGSADNSRTQLFQTVKVYPPAIATATSFHNKSKVSDQGRLCIAVNAFVGFSESYRRFSCAFRSLADTGPLGPAPDNFAWNGIPTLKFKVDYNFTKFAQTEGVSFGNHFTSTVRYGPKEITLVDDSTAYHELAHALVHWYYSNPSDAPSGVTISKHQFQLVSNLRHTYIEGWAEFIPLLFMDVYGAGYFSKAFLASEVFSKTGNASGQRPWTINDALGQALATLPPDLGFSIEGAFALALYAVWTDCVRGPLDVSLGEAKHVIKEDDGGELKGAANGWIKPPGVRSAFRTFILNPLRDAASSTTAETSIDVLAKIVECTVAQSKWAGLKPQFENLSLVFPFELETIERWAQAPTYQIVTGAGGKYKLVLQGQTQPTSIQLTLNQSQDFFLAGKYLSPDTSVKVLGSSPASPAGATFMNMREAMVDILPTSVGTFDVEIKSGGKARVIKDAIQVS